MNNNYSVGIPVRNEEKTISKTLSSIINQTIPPKIIYVCVNGSEDKSFEIIEDLSKTEKKIKILTSDPGKGNAWNEILKNSLENKILFCDGDVIINSSAAENMLKTFKNNTDLIIVGGANAYFPNKTETFFTKYFTENLTGKPIKQNWICGRLYMAKIKELQEIAKTFDIKLMPKLVSPNEF